MSLFKPKAYKDSTEAFVKMCRAFNPSTTEQLEAIKNASDLVPDFLRQSEIKKAHMREVGKTDRWLLISSVAYVLFFVVLLVAVWLR